MYNSTIVLFSDQTNGTVVHNIYYAKRHVVNKDDITTYAYVVHCNKSYHIKITATAKIRLVIVFKVHNKPELSDFFGGERLSNTATLLVVDFAMTRRTEYNSTVSGLGFVVVDANSSTISLFGTVPCGNLTTTVYVGIMPTVYDTRLCKRCMDNSNGPCGFCSGKDEAEDDGVKINVSLTVVRYVTDCVFWDPVKDNWKNDGCQVSVLCATTHVVYLHCALGYAA